MPASPPKRDRREPETSKPDARPALMKELGAKYWVNVPQEVFDFLISEFWPNALRVYALVMRQSWGYGRTSAVKEVHKTKYGHVQADPLRRVDISEVLGLDEPSVTRICQTLFGDGKRPGRAGKIEGKRIFLDSHPSAEWPKKLSDITTFFAEDPIFQQLENLKTEYREAIQQAIKTAVEPVRQRYLPKIQTVKAEFQARVRAKQPPGEGAPKIPEAGKVVKIDNFSRPSATPSEATPQKTASDAVSEKVVKNDNFQELSPIRRVVKNDNFSRRIKEYQDSVVKTGGNRAAGRSVKRGKPTDRPTKNPFQEELKALILRTGIPRKLGDTPRPQLYEQLAGILAGVPNAPQLFENRIRQRANAIQKLGMFIELAGDVARAYNESREQDAADSHSRQLGSTEHAGRMEADARAILNNPDSTPDEKSLAREILGLEGA